MTSISVGVDTSVCISLYALILDATSKALSFDNDTHTLSGSVSLIISSLSDGYTSNSIPTC